MLLTIALEHSPSSDIGYLFHKHPDRFHSVKIPVGEAHVFDPEVTETTATIALLLDINPIDLVRGRRTGKGNDFSLQPYVNDRPYVASSFMSVAISKAFSTAMNGKSKERPELVDELFQIEVNVSAVPAPKGGEELIKKLFGPLGYEITTRQYVLDDMFPKWGASKYFHLELSHKIRLKDLLTHLYEIGRAHV